MLASSSTTIRLKQLEWYCSQWLLNPFQSVMVVEMHTGQLNQDLTNFLCLFTRWAMTSAIVEV